MPLRLIEMVMERKDGAAVLALLKDHAVLEHRQVRLGDDEVLVRILLDAEQIESVLEALAPQDMVAEGTRVVVLPVEATLPRVEAVPDPADASDPNGAKEKTPERISRDELYEDIRSAAQCTRVYLAMVVLSTIVAAVGLYYDSVAIIIGAMVIAPLLGPNMAMSLGTTLGDLGLLRSALITALAGIATTVGLALIIGATLQLNPVSPEVATRTGVGLGDIAVALASGAAGALAFTSGVSATLIGVMVAVALLPPLVTFGLLLGGGHTAAAIGALSLFMMNLICINLAGVMTFLVQGMRPTTWWEKDRATKASRIAIGLWALVLAALGGMIMWLRTP